MIHAVVALAMACASNGVTGGSGYTLVRLEASGISCARARTVARLVVNELRRKQGLDVPGVNAFAMSTHTCAGCASTTSISLSYPSGAKVTLSLKRMPCSGTTV